VSRRLRLPILIGLLVAAVAALWPADVQARPHGRIVVGAGYFYPPYYYRPFYGAAFYSPFWGFYGGFPYWYGPYPYYAYPYRYDTASSVRVQVKPREAQVYVDGYFVGTVDDFDGWSQRLRLAPGEHEVQIYLDGYRPITEKNLFRPDTGYKIEHEMQRLAPGDAQPAPPTPTTPEPRRDAAPAPREPGMQQGPPRYPQAGAPRQSTAPADETEAGVEGFGQLAVRVQPADAEILIDGERWDSPASDEPITVQLATGPHHLEIRKDGFMPYSTDVVIRQDDVTRLNVSLPERK
jgi:hypothetical protein